MYVYQRRHPQLVYGRKESAADSSGTWETHRVGSAGTVAGRYRHLDSIAQYASNIYVTAV